MPDSLADQVLSVFGTNLTGGDIRQAAATSSAEFVRTQYHLSIAIPEATGYRLTALDALDQYGWEVLSRLADDHSTSLVASDGEPFDTIINRTADLGLDLFLLQQESGWAASDQEAFSSRHQVAFRKLDLLASKLGLQASMIGRAEGGDSNPLGARLRTLAKDSETRLSPGMVIAITEASRLLADYVDLRSAHQYLVPSYSVITEANLVRIRQISERGQKRPAWVVGFECADECRRILDVFEDDPVDSISRLIEQTFDLLLMYVSVDEKFTGCAIQLGRGRAIICNIATGGGDILLQRAALAHELGHILMDNDEQLNNVRVDQDRVFDDNIMHKDKIESRANAFAAQLLAPQSAVNRLYNLWGRSDYSIIRLMAFFGVSQTIIRHQLRNGNYPDIDSRFARQQNLMPQSIDKWMSRERNIYQRISGAISGLPHIRRNKLSLIGSILFKSNLLSLDRLNSIFGYGSANAKLIANKINSMPALNKLYVS